METNTLPEEKDTAILYATKEHVTISQRVINEVLKAERKHPDWPTDIIHQVAIMQEESGEAIRATIQLVYEGGSIDEVRKELIQTAAMCFRCLKNLPEE